MKRLVLAAFAALLICSTGLPARAADISLTYANFPPAVTFPCVQMERWADEVEKRTDGKVSVQTFPGGTLLGAKNMFRGVLQGQADIGCLVMSYQPGVFPLTTGVDLPLGFRTATAASLTLWDIYTKYQPEEFEDVKVLTMFTSAPSHLMSKTPVRSLADMQGMEIRASGTPGKACKAVGAVPVSMPMSQAPEALQKGLVQALLSSLEVLKDFNFAEMLRYETILDYPVYPFAVIMNKAKWEALPDDVKKVMEDLGREQAEWTGRYMDRHVQEAVKWSREKYDIEVITLPEAEMAEIKKMTAPLIDEWEKAAAEKGVPAKEVLADIVTLRDQYEAMYAE